MSLSKKEFVEKVIEAHIRVIDEVWPLWIVHCAEDIKLMKKGKASVSEKLYPEGFKAFLVEHLQKQLKDNSGDAKSNGKKKE